MGAANAIQRCIFLVHLHWRNPFVLQFAIWIAADSYDQDKSACKSICGADLTDALVCSVHTYQLAACSSPAAC